MALIDRLFGTREKSLSEMNRQELRKQEILLQRNRDRLLKKIEQLSTQKQSLFKQGAGTKSPELRKALAMDFDMRTQEQVLAGRELNLRGKELMTVSRLRMMRENEQHGSLRGRLNISTRDVAKITTLINNDAISQDMYQQQLDAILEAGSASDQDSLESAGLSQSSQELMHLWSEMDRGLVKEDEAFDQADKIARKKAAESDM